MKKTSKLVKIFFVLLLSFTTLIGVKAQTTQTSSELTKDWTYFLGNYEMPGVSDAKTPRDTSEFEQKWAYKLKPDWQTKAGNPIIIGDYIYIPVGNKLNKINKNYQPTLENIQSIELDGLIGQFSQIAYGDGKLFVPLSTGKIQAFDIQTMKSVWISEQSILKNSDGTNRELDIISPIIYYDGYIYSGSTNQVEGVPGKGFYFGIDVKDENPNSEIEKKNFSWVYGDDEKSSGFYWAGATIAKDSIIFAGEDGNLVSHRLKEDKINGTPMNIGGNVRSSVYYDKNTNKVFATSKSNGMIHSVELNDDLSFKSSTKISKYLAKFMTSSPVVYNGKVYVGGGGMETTSGFHVLEASTLNLIYDIPAIKAQGTPIITSAYENGENEVYVYIVGFNDGQLYSVKDNNSRNIASYSKLTTSLAKYDSSTVIIDYDGNIYLYDANNSLYAFGNKNGGAYTPDDVIRKINALPTIDNISETDYFDIHNLVKRYEKLSEADQGKVSNIDTLNKAYAHVLSLKDVIGKINKINKDIESLGAIITLQDENKITTMWNMYQGLNATDKTKVVNANKLIDLKAQLDKLLLDEKIKDINDKINKLDDIKDIPLNKKNDVMNLIQQVESLSKEDQKRITNKDKLYKTYQYILDSEKKIKDINDKIWNNIKPLNVTLDDESDIIEINKLYQSLRKQDQKLINNYQDVINAQRIIDALKDKKILPEVFDNIKGKDINYEFKGSVNNKYYSIKFNGLDIKESLSFNPEIKFFSDKNNDKIKGLDANALVICFTNHGKLPGKATIEIQTDLKDGIYHLFYFNETTNKAEFTQDVEVINGIAKFVIDHTSDYFLSKKATNDINTGDITNSNEYLIIFTLSLIAITGISLYTVKKKRNIKTK